MDQSKTEQFLLRAIRCLSYLVFLIPLLPSNLFFAPLLQQGLLGKAMVFEGLVAVIFGCYLVFCVLRRDTPWRVSTGRKDFAFIFLISYFFILLVTFFWSIDPFTSFWGSGQWQNGLVVLLAGFAFYLSLRGAVSFDKLFWQRALLVIFWGGAFSFLFAFSQHLILLFDKESMIRPVATLGNAAYFASYGIFPLFVPLYLAQQAKIKKIKYLYLIVFLLEFLVLIFINQTRGAIVGTLAGLILAAIVFLWLSRRKIARVLSKVSLGIIIIALIAVVTILTQKPDVLLSRVSRSEAIHTRLVNVGIAWEGIKERPWTGWGLENYAIPFHKYFDTNIYFSKSGSRLLSEDYFDFPHNKILEVAISSGILAAISYILIFVSLLISLLSRYKKTKEDTLLIIFALFVAYFVQNLFIFDNISSFIMFFGLLAFVSFVFECHPRLDRGSSTIKKYIYSALDVLGSRVRENDVVVSGIRIISLIVAVGLVGATAFSLVFQPARAAYFGARSYNSFVAGNYDKAKEELKKIKQNPESYMEGSVLENIAFILVRNNIIQPKDVVGKIEYATSLGGAMGDFILKHPDRISYSVVLSRMYINLGSNDKKFYEYGVSVAKNALDRGYKRIDLLHILTAGYSSLGEKEKALETINEAIAMKPDYGFSYSLQATAHRANGDDKSAMGSLEKAFELGYKNASDVELYIALAIDQKDYVKAENGYGRLVAIYPSDPEKIAILAIIQKERGDIESARKTIEDVIRRFPEFKSKGEFFLNSLK